MTPKNPHRAWPYPDGSTGNVVREVQPPRVQHDEPRVFAGRSLERDFRSAPTIDDVTPLKDDRLAQQLAKWLKSHRVGCDCKLCVETQKILP